MFNKSRAEIDYGNPPIREVLQISSDDDDVTVHYVTRFSKDGVFKKARFEKGWNVFEHENQLAEDDEVDFMLDVAANDDRVVFNTAITRSG
ncbi:hypothetical protein GH714_010062 [Hevea brasiliensis]|uniref:TF-B3 domain-containing protein n=1 Tax=Hevea brasiliensis TaxID=3981 RepID=A0A6A6L0X0_HEVBR|nr:hypothetical protein GH714_010062 [Hevea brasiliensis]